MTNQLIGAGTALYGASRLGMFKKGGRVQKDGGLAKLALQKITG